MIELTWIALRKPVSVTLAWLLVIYILPILGAILYLLRATDRISHGDFEREVELKRDDELGQIARAVERMRVSLREAMERLRRK